MTNEEMNRKPRHVPFVDKDDDGLHYVKCKLQPGAFLIMSTGFHSHRSAQRHLRDIRRQMVEAWEAGRRGP